MKNEVRIEGVAAWTKLTKGQEWFCGSRIARIEKTTPCTAIVSAWEPFGYPRTPYTRRYYQDTLEQWFDEPVPGELPTLREVISRLRLVARRRPRGEMQVFSQLPVLTRLRDYKVLRVTPSGSASLGHKRRRIGLAVRPRRATSSKRSTRQPSTSHSKNLAG